MLVSLQVLAQLVTGKRLKALLQTMCQLVRFHATHAIPAQAHLAQPKNLTMHYLQEAHVNLVTAQVTLV
jgi:hypothetical protein